MSAQPKASEPSMEEILASIRRIIADDQAKAVATPEAVAAPVVQAPVQAVQPVIPATEDEDVLDLTELAPADEPQGQDDIDLLFNEVAESEPEPAFVAPPVPVYVAPVSVAPAPVAPVMIEPPVQQAPPIPLAMPDLASLLSHEAGASVNHAFTSLANTVLSQNARTLDDLVKDMLRPMLKTWLDDNLPTVVERLVRAEIERVARGGR
jgi:uncharacterized protein